MREALFTKTAPPPPELEDLWLCKAFNCSITELREMDAELVRRYITCINGMNAVAEKVNKTKRGKRGR